MTRTHLVWDWNGTLLDDLSLVVSSTNHAFAAKGGRAVDADEHRARFRRPVAEFYAEILGRAVDEEEFGELAGEMSALLTQEALAARPLGVLRAAMAATDVRRLADAATAGEPLAAMNVALASLSIPIVWSAWRAARRSRR